MDRYPADLPRRWQEAVALLTEDTLQAHGILPWHLEKAFWDLVEAFRAQDAPRILKLSAEIGHYLGDAHVPLHTTANYNGQLTGQHGVHGLWESVIPEQFGDGYDYWVGRARLWRSVKDTIWAIVYESHALVETVLAAEREATQKVGPERKYVYRPRGVQTVRTYSEEFITVYHALLEGMVESRLQRAIQRLASLWYTAWHIAGRPSLPAPLREEHLPEEKGPDTLLPDPRCGEIGLLSPPLDKKRFIPSAPLPFLYGAPENRFSLRCAGQVCSFGGTGAFGVCVTLCAVGLRLGGAGSTPPRLAMAAILGHSSCRKRSYRRDGIQ